MSLVSAVGSYWFILAPGENRLIRAQAAYDDGRSAHARQEQARRLQEQMRSGKQDIEKVWETLPTQNQFPALAVAISELGKTVNVSIPGMTHAIQKSEDEMPVKGSLTFKVVGEYADIYRFIHRLEAADYYLVIESLDAARAGSVTSAGRAQVVFNVRVVTFLRPDALTIGES
jgi:Tfp pilus assembly protein PilO